MSEPLFTSLNDAQKYVLENPGLHAGLSEEEYFGLPALSNSMLNDFNKTPAQIMQKKKETPAMHFGRAFHCYVLEPSRFPLDYDIIPEDANFRTDVWKAWRAEKLAAGRVLLTPQDFEHIKGMKASLFSDDFFRTKLFNPLEDTVELTATWRWGNTMCKARLDIVNDRFPCAVDLKTAADASINAFVRSIFRYGYNRQAGWYLDGLAAADPNREWDSFFFAVVEKEPPYNTAMYGMEHLLFAAREQYQRLFGEYEICADSGIFPASYTPNGAHYPAQDW